MLGCAECVQPTGQFPSTGVQGFLAPCVGAFVSGRAQCLSLPVAMGVLQHSAPPHHRMRTACLSILPMLPSGPIARNCGTPWWPTINSFAKGLCSLAHTALSFPHNCSFSSAFLFHSHMLSSLTIPMHRSCPSTPSRGSPGSSC